jgi:hypothetical protein
MRRPRRLSAAASGGQQPRDLLGVPAAKVLGNCLTSDDERVRLAAAQQIFDRGYGKPNQSVDLKATVDSADIIKAGHERARALRGGKPVAGADIARNDAYDLSVTRGPAHE